MRNLKKLFAVILTVAMIASLMVPALAANTYDAEALQLQAINVFAGGPEDLKLDESVTRIQGLTFAIRAAGKDAEALAMEVAEVDAILADWTDAASIPSWGRAYAAYAIKNSITVGTSATEKTFGAMQIISGRALLVFIMKAGMGYADVTTVTAPEAAVEAGILTAGQAATFGANENLVRDDAAGILFGAFTTGVNADGTKLIDAYIASGATTLADAAAAGFVTANTMSVEAAKVDTLVATFAYAVDTADINLAVTKAGSKVDAAAPVWSDGNTVATIVTTAKMTNGTYTVTATSAADEDFELTGTTEVVSQYVAEIVILNDVALTSDDSKEAYVYYDVVDQYGESLRTSTSIQWSFSAAHQDVRSKGIVKLTRTDGNAFTYGEKIYITGVFAKTGISVTKEVTVGMKQALNSIDVAGFVKKGTTEILESLPSGFKANTYYMIYTMKDQNGNALDPDGSYAIPIEKNEVTFVSDNVLLIEKIKDGETTLVVGGDEYNAVFVAPGLSVAKGGEANITAIANKTGNKTVINVVVGEDQILKSFTLNSPSGVLADGETFTVPFIALDQNGQEIKNFTTLARQADFNKLTFTATPGYLELSENDDGTAKLVYKDEGSNVKVDWKDSVTTDGIDRIVTLTSIVTAGDTSNLTLNVSDKARPEAIKSISLDNVLVEGGSDTIYLNSEDDEDEDDVCSFVFLDQYGREMDKEDAGAFFAASGTFTGGSEFTGHAFAIRGTYKGPKDLFTGKLNSNSELGFGTGLNDVFILNHGDEFTIKALGDVTTSAKAGASIKFDIVKQKGTEAIQAVSSAKNEDLTVIDIGVVKGFAIDDLNKFYVASEHTTKATGEMAGFTYTTIQEYVPTIAFDGDYAQEVSVKGTYNGQDVSIPASYLTFESGKIEFDAAGKAVTTTVNAIQWSDLYDVATAKYTRKDASDTVKVVVYGEDELKIDTISKKIALSDAEPKVTTIEGDDTWTVAPDLTVISKDAIRSDDDHYEFKVKDQYGIELKEPEYTLSFRISSIVPNAAGYAENNFKVFSNDEANINVIGAERGDTFVLTVKAGDVTKDVKVTVKADKKATMTSRSTDPNEYLNNLVKNVLEPQRETGLN